MSSSVDQIFDVFLQEVVENQNKISSQTLQNLFSLFNTDFIESLQLIDEKCISLLKSPNNRRVFEVKVKDPKSTPNRYYCVIDANVCSCGQFRRGLLNDSTLLCKHLIASKLSFATNGYKTVDKTDAEIDRFWTKHIFN